MVSGIVFVIRNGLRWRDAPREYGPHKTIYNRWSRLGVFNRIFAELARKAGRPRRLMIDADERLQRCALMLPAMPKAKELLGDKGYDADCLRKALADKGVAACLQNQSQDADPARPRSVSLA